MAAGASPSPAIALVGDSFGPYTLRSISPVTGLPAQASPEAAYKIVLDLHGLSKAAGAPLTVTSQKLPTSAYTTTGLLTRGAVPDRSGDVRVRTLARVQSGVRRFGCLRGQLAPPFEPQWHDTTVLVPAYGAGTVTVVVLVSRGLVGMPAPQITLSSAPWRVDDGSPVPAGDVLAPAASLTVDLPQPALPQEAVALKLQKATGSKVRLIGRVLPARAGATVTIVGRKRALLPGNVTTDLFDLENVALGAANASVRRLATARTRADGRFAVWVKGKPRAVFAARTPGLKNQAVAGASCPVVATK